MSRPVLVIGYGNDLRGDDAVGRRVAESVAEWHLPGVVVHSAHQLTPELAEQLASARMAIFVDARLAVGENWESIEVAPIEDSSKPEAATAGHFGDPRHLLALTKALYGVSPRAWWVTIPAFRFDFGAELSPVTAEGTAVALREVRRLMEDG